MAAVALEAFTTPAQAAAAAADIIQSALGAAVAERGRASFAGSGGSTPGPVYDRLSTADLPWNQIDVTLTDERWVDAQSPESNERLLRERLLAGPASGASFTPLKGEGASKRTAAAEAGARIAAITPFDVVLLGMGEDGHIASLFPGNPALEAEGLAAWALTGDLAPSGPRLTLTFAALTSARMTVLLITGPAKRSVLDRGGDLPVHRYLCRATGPVRVLWAP